MSRVATIKKLDMRPVYVFKSAPKATLSLASRVARLHQDRAYAQVALEQSGPEAIELALRGRTLRDLAKATGLSATYLSLVQCRRQRISLRALQLLLAECEGVSRE